MKESTLREIEALPLDKLKSLWKMCYLLWAQRALQAIDEENERLRSARMRRAR